MSKRMKIAFSINDWTEQEILITSAYYTQQQVFEMMKHGEVFTSIQEGGDLIMVKDGKVEKVGEVVTNEQGDGDFFDYELLNTWETED